MSGEVVKGNVAVGQQLFRKLEALQKSVEQRDALLRSIGEAMQKSVRKRFDTSTGPDGQKWTPLRKKTIQRKHGENKATPLIDHGNLMGSIRYQIAGDTAFVGTNDKRAAAHQFGWTLKIPAQTRTQTVKFGTKGKTKGRFVKKSNTAKHVVEKTFTFTISAHEVSLPARPFLGLSEADKKTILALVREHVAAAVEKGGDINLSPTA
ncbi:MAG: phage virion morphogenesis protein [Myxococcales bacterium]|jgi:phage virion morphogenesis protein|nr:phage virion morphogenesis protein [Myxococcales bacterium]